MKKIFSIFVVLFALTACSHVEKDAVVNQPSPDGIDANYDDLVYVTDVYERDGKAFVSVDPMEFLTDEDGTCSNAVENSDLPQCGGSGFTQENKEIQNIEYEVPLDKTVFFVIDWGTSTESSYPMSFSDFEQKFSENKSVFEVTPYHLEATGNQVVSLTEKYIP
ncbi:MAG: membrane lipoprotein lipid attachment site-containing protein [Candidatus Gracilibacteria bacterium]